jgi:hypothetical protein
MKWTVPGTVVSTAASYDEKAHFTELCTKTCQQGRATPKRLFHVDDVVQNGIGLANRREFHDCGKGTADNNVILRCGWGRGEENAGVVVIPPDGKRIDRVHLAERCANLCFGGVKRNRLFMAAGYSIYAHYDNTQRVPVPKPSPEGRGLQPAYGFPCSLSCPPGWAGAHRRGAASDRRTR